MTLRLHKTIHFPRYEQVDSTGCLDVLSNLSFGEAIPNGTKLIVAGLVTFACAIRIARTSIVSVAT